LQTEKAKSHLNDSSTFESLLEEPTIETFKKVRERSMNVNERL
jgi:hypothetical protein